MNVPLPFRVLEIHSELSRRLKKQAEREGEGAVGGRSQLLVSRCTLEVHDRDSHGKVFLPAIEQQPQLARCHRPRMSLSTVYWMHSHPHVHQNGFFPSLAPLDNVTMVHPPSGLSHLKVRA